MKGKYVSYRRNDTNDYLMTAINNKEIEDHPKRKRTNHDRASDIGNILNAFMYSEKGEAFIDSLSGKYDAMVDPEDFVLGYQSPLILLNDSKFKESNNPKQIKNEKWYKDHPDAYVPKKYLKQVNKYG